MQGSDKSGAAGRPTGQQNGAAAGELRGVLRLRALENAMAKRAAGVPSYSVPEAAVLMSISQEYLYRLIQSDGFPAVHMRAGGGQGRYVVPAAAVDQLLAAAVEAGRRIESATFTAGWYERVSGGAA
ncbi:MAG: helix-turn-helix domain-containing protein [Pseudonocardia sp.]|nr:helix-turn-helix domain-containing protein [Pseudonocardia sp.]